ncbi:Uncharacterised protein [Vibrio cholerae]|nr:Uncharacterised protein [Vibrio cholerae]CSD15318.1 Uncharacterised protein [Vibrio cholerae]
MSIRITAGKPITKFCPVKRKWWLSCKSSRKTLTAFISQPTWTAREKPSLGTFVRSSVAMKSDINEWYLTKSPKTPFSRLLSSLVN